MNTVLRALAAGLLPLVVACTSLPSIAPGVAGAPNAPVPVGGAGGALTPSQSKAVLGRLAAAAPFLGGINISSVYSGGSAHRHSEANPSWRDTDLQLQGPLVYRATASTRP